MRVCRGFRFRRFVLPLAAPLSVFRLASLCLISLCLVCLCLAAPAKAQDLPEAFLALPTRPGVTLPLAVLAPEHPRGAVILLAGGKGKLDITEQDGKAVVHIGGNFLVRSRQLFAAQGLAVLVADAPSDRPDGLSAGFRVSAAHVEDLRKAVAYARERWGLKPWLVGTSMGTFSAAWAGARLPQEELGGVVLTSTIAKAAKRWELPAAFDDGVLGAGLGSIRVPALVVRHKDDACAFSAPSAGPKLLEALTNAPRKALLSFEGGLPAQSEACEAKSAHGYLGIEAEVVAGIAAFILLDAGEEKR
jgi:Lysophospholipase